MRVRLVSIVLLPLAIARKVAVVGAGWGGLGAAHHLSQQEGVQVVLLDAAPRVGGLIRDGFETPGGRRAEAGQHGFWADYHNIFRLTDELGLNRDEIFTQFAEQGQYSPRGLEAVWPVYAQLQQLPTGLAQGLYTRFLNLPPTDLITAAPLAAALAELDFKDEAVMAQYDRISFRDLCDKLGVSKRMYDEAFEPMILTGLFAPGTQVSAAAALGMAYFFVLRSQGSFDVRWVKGNVGELIFDPWVGRLKDAGVEMRPNSRVASLIPSEDDPRKISSVGLTDGSTVEVDDLVLAVGVAALRGLTNASPFLAATDEFAAFTRLRGTDCLATRLWFDKPVSLPYTANPAWGFDDETGMTFFDLRAMHSPAFEGEPGAVIEMDFYNAASLIALSDEDVASKCLQHLKKIFPAFADAAVVDAAVVRLPNSVTWFAPGSYPLLPKTKSRAFGNVYFAGDYVRSNHGSWSQEKAYVTGMEACNAIMGREVASVIQLQEDEVHVKAARGVVRTVRNSLPFPLPGIPGRL